MFDINKKSKEFIFLFIPGLVIVIFSSISFLVTGFFDREIDAVISKTIDYFPVKIWASFMEEFGIYNMMCFVFILLGVIWETIFFYQKKFGKKQFIKNNQWMVYIYYALGFIIWVASMAIAVKAGFSRDFGYGPGNDPYTFISQKYRTYSTIFIKILELGVMIVGFVVLRFKFAKREDILLNEYWTDALKGCVWIVFMYIVVVLGKMSFGRPYPYTVDFENSLRRAHESGWTYTPETGYFGTGPDGTSNVDYLPWWIPNDFFKNFKNWFVFNAFEKDNNGWWNRDFPSGHTAATSSMVSIMFLFINPNKKRKLTWYKLAYIYFVFLIILPSMKFGLMAQRTHWASDLEFTTIFAIGFIPLANYFVNRHVRCWKNKFNAKHHNKTKGYIIEQKIGFVLYVQTPNYDNRVCLFYNGKNKAKKIEKIIKKYNIDLVRKEIINSI
ncbi:phosphatase PAP2 family protein [Spiroplasma tabanidicola]|uniref:Phosphatase PAP2 family protein n=1 Tax=Spiroplasma tabanidicola TaxID=324079 RepID=A0A6I6CA95_9MOLU|nr:phosphatase PAP2 family protein [Spiroplasma tabanidicola]QGS52379.1 phosphatase PAP2 family protein [Spiroplasma tabanidicola]